MSLSVYEPLRNEQKLLLDAINSGLFPKQTVGKLKKVLNARKAAEATLAENAIRQHGLRRERGSMIS